MMKARGISMDNAMVVAVRRAVARYNANNQQTPLNVSSYIRRAVQEKLERDGEAVETAEVETD